MNWMSIKEGETIMWMKISRKFKSYTKRKIEDNRKMKKEREFKMKKFYYTNYMRYQQNSVQHNQYLYKMNSITWKNI